jgi:peptidoglycan hydrolase CwlO-like protein
MSDQNYAEGSGESNLVRNVILAVAGIYVIVSLFLIFDLRSRVQSMEETQKATVAAEKEIQDKLHMTSSAMAQSVQSVEQKVGETKEEFAKRTADLQRRQQAGFNQLTEEQKKQKQNLSQVSGEVSGVKTDLGGAKTDIANTKNDLESTKAKLEKAIGDLGVQSGLIATNHDELELLKHRGDRNYIEFTLKKNQRQPVGTVSLQLRKTDPKRSKFTLNVMADDKTIEKKDRTANEPLQFYTSPGGARQLYELVVFGVTKDTVTGYLSTPKS